MRISIVTPSFNHGHFIEDAIRSVMNQDHDDVEHVVMDGGSTDSTVPILSKYPHLKWISEQDSGQGNAINKGFRKATGDILAWLNSDDFYEANVFKDVATYFETHPDCMLLYGDITYVGREGNVLSKLSGDVIDYDKLIECPDIVRQPSFFWRRKVMEELGELDETLHLVMDFDLFLRIAGRYKFHYLNKNLSYFRTYGENKTSALPRRQVREIYRVFRKQRIPLRRSHLKYFSVKLLDAFGIGNVLRTVVRPLRKRKTV